MASWVGVTLRRSTMPERALIGERVSESRSR